ncbi:MAG: hypothetical protein J6U54_03540 [Clostridiales bacterium]|nr:hypothetical protein [Clostridiales bacterium]
MSERTQKDAAKARACYLIREYIRFCPTVYPGDFEKQCHYKWALNEALIQIRSSKQTTLDVLYTMLSKYDVWAHLDTPNKYMFAVASAAIEDIIDMLLQE